MQRTATQRQYTTPVLKPGTRYEVEIKAVSSIGEGSSSLEVATTGELVYFIDLNSVLMTKEVQLSA